MYCCRELIVSIVVSAIVVFKVADNILSSSEELMFTVVWYAVIQPGETNVYMHDM